MRLSIRKARRIEQQLQFLIDEPIKTSVDVSIYSDELEVHASNVLGMVDESLERIDEYTDVRFEIRRLISEFNQTSGINDLMNQEARVKSMIRTLSNVIDSPVSKHDSIDGLKKERDIMVSRSEALTDSYHKVQDMIRIESMQADDVDVFESSWKDLKLQQVDLADKMLGLNIEGGILITDEHTAILKNLGFV